MGGGSPPLSLSVYSGKNPNTCWMSYIIGFVVFTPDVEPLKLERSESGTSGPQWKKMFDYSCRGATHVKPTPTTSTLLPPSFIVSSLPGRSPSGEWTSSTSFPPEEHKRSSS